MRALPMLLLLAACGSGTLTVKGDSGVTDGDDTGTPPTGDDTGPTTGDDTGTTPVTLPPDHVVDCDGGGDFTRIQDAIDAAVSGDRIGVEPCTYRENLDFSGKDLDIYGLGDRADVIVDGGGATVVTVARAEREGTRLATVTLTGGRSADGGAAVEVWYANLRLEDVDITGNDRAYAAVYGLNGFLDLVDVHVADNDVQEAAVLADAGSLTVERGDIDCDGGNYAIYQHDASLVSDSVLACRAGYALYSYHGEVNLRRSYLTGTVGLYVEDYEGSTDERVYVWNTAIGGTDVGVDIQNESLEMANSVVWGDRTALSMAGLASDSWVWGSAFVGADCGITTDGDYDLRWNAFSDVRREACGDESEDSITEDALFVAFPDDLTLAAGSAAIDAGPSGSDWEDADGTRNDVGVYGGPLPARF